MNKYFYTNGVDKICLFSFEGLKNQSFIQETKMRNCGLRYWMLLSEIEGLSSINKTFTPQLKEIEEMNNNPFPKKEKSIQVSTNKNKYIRIAMILLTLILVNFFAYAQITNKQKESLYQKIAESAYEGDVDFDFYVDKFYRDIAIHGLLPQKPTIKIIRFAKLDQIKDTTHIHGLSFGMNDDDRIEIYINPSTWKSFSKAMRYYLIYHELAHDVLNVDDLKNIPANQRKLMFPAISTYESITMDDFIEHSHALFEEVAKNN